MLCDTSGSMDPHGRFLLAFLLALKKAARRTELFAFNTALVRLTPWVSAAKIGATLERLAAGVPDWSGGTRIGASLSDFAARYLTEMVDAKTVVVIVSDGLDRGDTDMLARAMRAIRLRARRVIWLNPLLGRPALRADRAGDGGRAPVRGPARPGAQSRLARTLDSDGGGLTTGGDTVKHSGEKEGS